MDRCMRKKRSTKSCGSDRSEKVVGESKPRRKFRQDWLQQFSWLKEQNEKPFCIACQKTLYNHLSVLNKHSQNDSHLHNMARKGEEIDVLKCCRLCAKFVKSRDLQKLFIPRYRTKLKQIEELTGLQLHNAKNLPDLVCMLCNSELERMLQFKERCLEAQKYFESAKYKQTNLEEASSSDIEEIEELASSVPEHRLLPNKESQKSQVHENVEELWLIEGPTVPLLQACSESSETIDEEEFIAAMVVENEVKSKMIVDNNKTDFYRDQKCETPLSDGSLAREAITVENKLESYIEQKCKTYICDQCGNNFTCRHHFTIHMRRHAGDKRFHCELCPDKFFTNSELNRHMRRHTGEKPFACRHCDRRFTDYSSRIKHERTHTNDRPFSCGQCGKAFTTSYVLKNHMLTHTGERSFVCTLCNKAFPRATNLAMHNRSITHRQNEEKHKPVPVLIKRAKF